MYQVFAQFRSLLNPPYIPDLAFPLAGRVACHSVSEMVIQQ